jgi:hypothetical protein
VKKRTQAWARGIRREYLTSIGRRGLMLFVLAVQFGLYGIAVLTAAPNAGWWPVYADTLLGLPVNSWGYIWVGCSIFLLFGAPLKRDRAQFGLAAGMAGLWAAAAFYTAIYWGPGVTYASLAFLILLCSSWPDPTPVLAPEEHL